MRHSRAGLSRGQYTVHGTPHSSEAQSSSLEHSHSHCRHFGPSHNSAHHNDSSLACGLGKPAKATRIRHFKVTSPLGPHFEARRRIIVAWVSNSQRGFNESTRPNLARRLQLPSLRARFWLACTPLVSLLSSWFASGRLPSCESHF